MSLKVRMIFLCLFIAAIGLTTGVVGYVSVDSVSKTYNPIATESIPVVQTLGDLRGEFRELRIQIRSIAFIGTTHADVEKYVKEALIEVDEVDQLFANYEKVDPTAHSRDSYQDLQNKWMDFKKFGGELVEKSKNYEQNQTEIVNMIRNVCPVKAEAFYAALKKETDFNLNEVSAATASALVTEGNSRQLTVVIGLVALLLSGVISYLFSKRLSNSIMAIAAQITEANQKVTSSVETLAHSGADLSDSSSRSAGTLEETVASLEELTSMVKLNTDNAKQAASISSSSRDAAEKGEKDIHKLINSMKEISQSSKKIEDIISVIDDIAFQTNLLALNAAVEAARAGEQGKGFAVVAEAVRSLAQRSASAAKDINDLIKETVVKVEHGGRIADESGIILNNIVSSVKKVSDLNMEISAASTEQSTGIQHLAGAMNQLDQAAQGNAASAEEIAATSQDINRMSSEALRLTQALNTVILGHKNAPGTAEAEQSDDSFIAGRIALSKAG